MVLSQTCDFPASPWKSKDYFLNGFSVKTIVLVGIYNQQFKGTILFMVFDFQGSCWLLKSIVFSTLYFQKGLRTLGFGKLLDWLPFYWAADLCHIGHLSPSHNRLQDQQDSSPRVALLNPRLLHCICWGLETRHEMKQEDRNCNNRSSRSRSSEETQLNDQKKNNSEFEPEIRFPEAEVALYSWGPKNPPTPPSSFIGFFGRFRFQFHPIIRTRLYMDVSKNRGKNRQNGWLK